MDKQFKLARDYVGASCNRYPNVLDWGVKYIAFGSCYSIALFNVEVCYRYGDDNRNDQITFFRQKLSIIY